VVLEPDPQTDPEAGERLFRQLRADLRELDVESVSEVLATPAPANAKAGDAVTVGAVIVALSASGGVFTSVIVALQDWLGRHSGRHRISVTVDGDTIELDRASAEQQRALVDAFVRRHVPE
jgi:hypothetical protein